MYCPNCGMPLAPNARVCNNCGCDQSRAQYPPQKASSTTDTIVKIIAIIFGVRMLAALLGIAILFAVYIIIIVVYLFFMCFLGGLA